MKIAISIKSYDPVSQKFHLESCRDAKLSYDRPRMHNLLKELGAVHLWESLPCACPDATGWDHVIIKAPERKEGETNDDLIVQEFARHTLQYKTAFWDMIRAETDAEKLYGWIIRMHPILCCKKRHADRNAMLDFTSKIDPDFEKRKLNSA